MQRNSGISPRQSHSAWLFLRGISLVYGTAFLSLSVQARGLWGTEGIQPIAQFLSFAHSQMGPWAWLHLPGIFWANASDLMLVVAASAGVVAALLAFAGILVGPLLSICLILYLSFVTAGQDFMSFQWDSLLVETGFLALFVSPWRKTRSFALAQEPHPWVAWAMFFLLFKLMFLSGVVKLLSGDPAWRDLTSLTYHYWTQPIPNPLAPFLHALPAWLHKASTAIVLVIEIVVPFFIFVPRLRAVAALSFIGLSLLILASGNYAFFNWLTLILTLWLVPESYWQKMRSRLSKFPDLAFQSTNHSRWVTVAMIPILTLSIFWSVHWALPQAVYDFFRPATKWAQAFRISNSYGLFATMTKTRNEIVIEGSLDGEQWKEYEFRFKSGSLERRPPFVAPHQPRLDWQMWFAALAPYQYSPWLGNLMARLLDGSPSALSLLAENPFPDEPPAFIRLKVYKYEFASPATIATTGHWWHRQLLGDFSPTYRRELKK
jgi:lipase maturation factor 1